MLKTRSIRRRSSLASTVSHPVAQQRGMMILEALVSIMIVMLGILGIAGLLARSTSMAGQAQYRTEAGMFAEQIVQLISLSVDRSTPENLATSLKNFQHQESGTTETCTFSGSSVNDSSAMGQVLMAARGDLTNVAGLPGALENGQQVQVDTVGNLNRVTVTLCWQGPNDAAKRNYQVQAFVH